LTEPGPGGDPRRALREQMRARRQALAPAARMQAADAVARHFSSADLPAGYVAGYWATGGELPLHVQQLRLRPDQVWCLPCLADDGGLRFAPWRSGDPLVSNRFGIPEPDLAPASWLAPADVAVVLLPLVAFSAAGVRLGMGGGYYDRAFAFRRDAPAPPRLVGVGYDLQRVDGLRAEPWDVPLDAVLTESGLHPCPAAG
jgi:5-formyltetrahydrofolate cyclo-ligase